MRQDLELLPFLDPFAKGLVEFAKTYRQFDFMVTHGGRVQAPRNPHALINLLTHKSQKKVGRKPTDNFTWVLETYGNHYVLPTHQGRFTVRGNPTFNLRVKTGGSEVSISFSDIFKPVAWVVSVNIDFAGMGQER